MPEADRNYDCIGTDVQYWDRQNASFAAYVIVGRSASQEVLGEL